MLNFLLTFCIQNDKKFETSKHHLITEKNLDQKHCFSTTNGPSEVDTDLSDWESLWIRIQSPPLTNTRWQRFGFQHFF